MQSEGRSNYYGSNDEPRYNPDEANKSQRRWGYKEKKREPMGFGKTMLASALGFVIGGFVLSFVGFFIMVALMLGMVANMGKETAVAPSVGSFVTINLSQPIREAAPSELETMVSETGILSVEQIINGLASARDDDNVNGVYIRTGASDMSFGVAEELRQALIDFQESGKPVIVYGESYTQQQYFMASVASHIFLHPAGMIDFRGIGAQPLFYKDLFDKLGVKVELIRPQSCNYKTAGETYSMNHMSEANREQIRVYINSIWDYVSNNIAASRNLTVDKVNEIADNLSGYLAESAKKNGLVDKLCFENEVKELMKDKYGRKSFIGITSYAESMAKPATSASNKIAVIYAQGDVVSGYGSPLTTAVYGDAIADALDKAAKDSKVKAIVLRVNSPGGAATASEIMTDAVIRAKKEKPVIVSMSDLAASAGYEMSCMATKIVAQPTTITGSIGVFSTIPEIGTLLSKKLGITTDTVQTNKNSTGLSLMRPLSPTSRALMQNFVEDFYITFVSRVAEGRHLDKNYVDSIARGRVWTGRDALKLGLVDTLGGLPLAIRLAATEAGINDYRAVQYPAPKDLMTQLRQLRNSGDVNVAHLNLWGIISGRARMVAQPMDIESRILRDLETLSKEPTLQARMPYYLVEM